jgi:transposase
VLVGRVVIGLDPHKRSATIEVLDDNEQQLAAGRFGTDSEGYRRLLAAGRQFPQRVWAVEGCQGVGRHLAQRLVVDGETVVDVPAKLSARARVEDVPSSVELRWRSDVIRRRSRSHSGGWHW